MRLDIKDKHNDYSSGSLWKYKSISDSDFRKLRELIHERIGIRMPPAKRVMLESRLQKRLRILGMHSFSDYCAYLFSETGIRNELSYFIDVMTTNKTDFFREPSHFDYLVNFVIPWHWEIHGEGINNTLAVWSAGCATGEEAYTLGMILQDIKRRMPGFCFSITASDISGDVLEKAKTAVYSEDKAAPIPMEFKKRYILRSKDRQKNLIRIAPEIRTLVKFMAVNLMEKNSHLNGTFDIIFCRNVIIYFDRETQKKVLTNLYNALKNTGYLFLGHSETLCGMDIPFKAVAPTVYKKN